MTSQPQTLIDPTTGRPVLMAPSRQKRPILTGGNQSEDRCPFCPGHEKDTPPQVLARRVADGAATEDSSWDVRAFPNLYPAAQWHEVIAEGRVHSERPADLDAALWSLALRVAGERMAFLEDQDGIECAFWFKNVGRMAGASIAHNHSQVLGLEAPPPRLLLENEHIGPGAPREGYIAEDVQSAADDGRLVFEAGRFAVLSPSRPKLPFETWIAARTADGPDFVELSDGDRDDLARCLHATFQAFETAFGAPPFNAWLHRLPRSRFHWHFELQPRTGFMAGLELGGDMYINSIPGHQSAARFRGEE